MAKSSDRDARSLVHEMVDKALDKQYGGLLITKHQNEIYVEDTTKTKLTIK